MERRKAIMEGKKEVMKGNYGKEGMQGWKEGEGGKVKEERTA